jgi:hypothetical protein
LVGGADQFDWRETWSGLRRFARLPEVHVRHATNFNSRVARRVLPRIALYAAAVILSFAIGAWVALYL